jgi:hypothetical protein
MTSEEVPPSSPKGTAMETLTGEQVIKLEAQRIRVALEQFGDDALSNSLRLTFVLLPEDNPQAWTELRRLVFALRHN